MKNRVRAAATAALLCAQAAAAALPAQGPKSEASPRAAAAALYAKHCATCHGKDGRAKTFKAKFNHARDLTDPAWQSEVSDERVFNSISRGRGKKMPAFGKKLSTEQLESLVAHVRGLKQ
jgi:mono/diheme cytochrome c family protein